ncbi:hypothetical protein ACZ90_24025 [Streptomyces albus subsp. albus]|nr:hypothetical protein ACZ90_24025 [Streptomyces albus subsp. albus]
MGEVVEVEGGVDFGVEDGVEALGGEAGEDAVVDGAGGVDDGGEGVLVGDGGQEVGQGVVIGGVAGGDGWVRAELGEVVVEFGGARGIWSAAADQEEVAYSVSGEVEGDA